MADPIWRSSTWIFYETSTIFLYFAWERLLRGFWSRWLRIWSQNLKIQNGG